MLYDASAHEEELLRQEANMSMIHVSTTDIDEPPLGSEHPRKEYRGIKAEGEARLHNGDIYSMGPVH
jgi:hypothetical protein